MSIVSFYHLGRAKPAAVERLARFLGVRMPKGEGAAIRLATRIVDKANAVPVKRVKVPRVALGETA